MEVNIQRINGNWDLGYSLDKHVLQSVYLGENQWGHAEFDTTRSEVGEALFLLKYRSDFTQTSAIADQMTESLSQHFSTACLVIPMPASKQRERQPVREIAIKVAENMKIPCLENLLIKNVSTPQMKDSDSRDEKVDTLVKAFAINDVLGDGDYDILIVDDLYDTGSSLEAATKVLNEYSKIRKIYVATVTRKR